MKKNVLVVTGTRAEYGLLKTVIREIQKSRSLRVQLLVTGMHTLKKYGYTLNDIRKDRISIDCIVPIRESDSMQNALIKEQRGIKEYLRKEQPALTVVLGDRVEPLAAALAAKELGIPVAHIHGGDKTGPGPDERIRTRLTKLSALHFPATKKSAARIKKLKEEAWRIKVAGTPGLDSLVGTHASRASIAKKLKLDPRKKWLLFVQHPVAEDSVPLSKQIKSLEALSEFSTHERIVIYPNSDTGSRVFISRIKKLRKGIRVFVSLHRDEYVSLLKESEVIIGNSSSGIIEANFLGTPAVDVGARQKGRERGQGVIHSSYAPRDIVRTVRNAVRLKKRYGGRPIPSPYGRGSAGKIIVQVIERQISNPRLLKKNR